LIFILFTGTISGARAESVSRYLYTSTFKLENRGEAPYTLTDLETTILLFMNNRWQTVSIRNSTHSIAHETFDVDGNRIAELDLPSTLPPGSDMTFSIVYEIESLNQPKPEIDPSEADPFSAIPSELVEEFSVETETFNARDEEIYEMALRLTENETTVLGSVSRLIEWITVLSFSSPSAVP